MIVDQYEVNASRLGMEVGRNVPVDPCPFPFPFSPSIFPSCYSLKRFFFPPFRVPGPFPNQLLLGVSCPSGSGWSLDDKQNHSLCDSAIEEVFT